MSNALKRALVSKPRESRPVKVRKRSLEKTNQNILEQVPIVSRKAVERALKSKQLPRSELKRVEENILLQIERLVAEQFKGGKQVNSHIQGVARTARDLAAHYGLSQTKVLLFEVAGLVHDVGKLYSKEIIETLVTGAMLKEEFSQRQKKFYTAHEELSFLMLEQESWIDIPLVLHIVVLGTEKFKALKPEIKRYCPYTWKELEQMAALFRLTDIFVALSEKGRRYSHPVLTKNNVGQWLDKKKHRGPWAKGLKRKKILEFFKSAADPNAKGNTSGSSPMVPENQIKGDGHLLADRQDDHSNSPVD
jgi:HD superfamily phosphohydrolase YqeK